MSSAHLTEHIEPLVVLLGYEVDTSHVGLPQIETIRGGDSGWSQERPLGIVIEDIHWLPANGLRTVSELLEPFSDASLFVVLTARPGVVEPMDRWAARRHIHRLQLGPLSRRSSEELVRQTNPGVDDGALKTLVSRAEGTPLFLKELALARGGSENFVTPPTIEGVVQARLDREPPECQELLRACSIFGRSFPCGCRASRVIENIHHRAFAATLNAALRPTRTRVTSWMDSVFDLLTVSFMKLFISNTRAYQEPAWSAAR